MLHVGQTIPHQSKSKHHWCRRFDDEKNDDEKNGVDGKSKSKGSFFYIPSNNTMTCMDPSLNLCEPKKHPVIIVFFMSIAFIFVTLERVI